MFWQNSKLILNSGCFICLSEASYILEKYFYNWETVKFLYVIIVLVFSKTIKILDHTRMGNLVYRRRTFIYLCRNSLIVYLQKIKQKRHFKYRKLNWKPQSQSKTLIPIGTKRSSIGTVKLSFQTRFKFLYTVLDLYTLPPHLNLPQGPFKPKTKGTEFKIS